MDDPKTRRNQWRTYIDWIFHLNHEEIANASDLFALGRHCDFLSILDLEGTRAVCGDSANNPDCFAIHFRSIRFLSSVAHGECDLGVAVYDLRSAGCNAMGHIDLRSASLYKVLLTGGAILALLWRTQYAPQAATSSAHSDSGFSAESECDCGQYDTLAT